MFIRLLDTPARVVLKFTPEMSMSLTGSKMAKSAAQVCTRFARQSADSSIADEQ